MPDSERQEKSAITYGPINNAPGLYEEAAVKGYFGGV
jgi:hypothetical protein